MRRLTAFLLAMAVLFAGSCAAKRPVEPTPGAIAEPTPDAAVEPPPTAVPYVFRDSGVKAEIERSFDKTAETLTDEDYAAMADYLWLSVYEEITTLDDLPILFPKLRYVDLGWYNFGDRTMAADISPLLELGELRAASVYSGVIMNLSIVKSLDYVDIAYAEAAYTLPENNLAELSVLGADFIRANVTGNIAEYVRVIDGDRAFELVGTRSETVDEYDERLPETRVFVSELREGEYACVQTLDVTDRIGNASGGLVIADADFDGVRDVLVLNGSYGAQGLTIYTCFLNRGGVYKKCAGFSDVPNPAIDAENKKILGTIRSWAASHSWMMYEFVDGVLAETERLTEEPIIEEGHGEGDEIWSWTVERLIDGEMREAEHFTARDLTEEEIFAKIYAEDSHWALVSDKWGTLYNLGSLYGAWSMYDSPTVDAQIWEIINK
jgi:hypothetical protein